MTLRSYSCGRKNGFDKKIVKASNLFSLEKRRQMGGLILTFTYRQLFYVGDIDKLFLMSAKTTRENEIR